MSGLKADQSSRIKALTNRLVNRRRFVWAARIFGDWMMQSQEANPDYDHSSTDHWRYGSLLEAAGRFSEAAEVFRKLAMDGLASTSPVHHGRRSFEKWAACLDASGFHRSAAETRALGRRARRQWIKHSEEEERAVELLPSRLLAVVTGRITFGMSLVWDVPTASFELKSEDGYKVLRQRFRCQESDLHWLEFEARAPDSHDASFPHVALSVKFPWRFSDPQLQAMVYPLLNQMNLDHAGSSACLEPDTGQIAIRSQVVFTGFNHVDPDSDLPHAQGEVTLNMFAEVLGTAVQWLPQIAQLHDRYGQ